MKKEEEDFINLNPMFNSNTSLPKAKIKTKTNSKTRKIRSDKKVDVQVPLLLEDRKRLRIRAYGQKKSMTAFASFLVEKAIDLGYIEHASVRKYEKSKQYVHVKLSQSAHAKLHSIAVEWDVSVREAAHRILLFMLDEHSKSPTT